MSQSPLTPTRNVGLKTYLENWNSLSELIQRGQSFSGRERNCVFLNLGDHSKKWADVSGITGLDFIDDGRAVATCDWDHDGDLDIWIANRSGPRVRFMRNNMRERNRSIQFRLVGEKQNRDAIGARIQLLLSDGSDRIQTVRAGGGFVSQSSKWIHFGLGDAQQIEQAVVRWPDGQSQRVSNLRNGTRYTLRKTSGVSPDVVVERQGSRDVSLSASSNALVPESDHARIVLTKRRPVARFTYQSFSGNSESSASSTNGPVLICLWASWCTNCQAELAELRANWPNLQTQGVRVLALCADELIGSETASKNLADAAAIVDRLELPFSVGYATKNIVDSLTSIQDQALYRSRPLPLPASFFLDSDEQLAVMYRGRFTIDQLLNDVTLVKRTSSSMADAFPFPGRDGIELFPRTAVDMARAYEEGGYFDDAEQELVRYLVKTKRAIAARTLRPTKETKDKLERAYLSLAEMLRRQDRRDDALAVLDQAINLFPDSNRLQRARSAD